MIQLESLPDTPQGVYRPYPANLLFLGRAVSGDLEVPRWFSDVAKARSTLSGGELVDAFEAVITLLPTLPGAWLMRVRDDWPLDDALKSAYEALGDDHLFHVLVPVGAVVGEGDYIDPLAIACHREGSGWFSAGVLQAPPVDPDNVQGSVNALMGLDFGIPFTDRSAVCVVVGELISRNRVVPGAWLLGARLSLMDVAGGVSYAGLGTSPLRASLSPSQVTALIQASYTVLQPVGDRVTTGYVQSLGDIESFDVVMCMEAVLDGIRSAVWSLLGKAVSYESALRAVIEPVLKDCVKRGLLTDYSIVFQRLNLWDWELLLKLVVRSTVLHVEMPVRLGEA